MSLTEEMSVEKAFGLPPLRSPHKDVLDRHVSEQKLPTEYSYRDPKAVVGIEVEVENVLKIDPNIGLVFWMVKEDGSLRNHGREFVTPPIPAFYSLPALHLLINGLNRDHEFTKRTSIHVHVNMRNLTASQVLSSLLVYHLAEPLLFEFVGGNRVNNIFCVPWTTSEHLRYYTGNSDSWSTLQSLRASTEKYTALNIIPLETFGTLEFRHMPGTNDVKKIVRWIDMLTSIRLYGMKFSLTAIHNEITGLNTNSQYEKFLENVFGLELKALLNTTHVLEQMERQVLDVKMCLLSAKFHKKKMEVQYRSPEFLESALMQFFKKKFTPEQLGKAKKASKKFIIEGNEVRPGEVQWANGDMANINLEVVAGEIRRGAAGAVAGNPFFPQPRPGRRDRLQEPPGIAIPNGAFEAAVALPLGGNLFADLAQGAPPQGNLDPIAGRAVDVLGRPIDAVPAPQDWLEEVGVEEWRDFEDERDDGEPV